MRWESVGCITSSTLSGLATQKSLIHVRKLCSHTLSVFPDASHGFGVSESYESPFRPSASSENRVVLVSHKIPQDPTRSHKIPQSHGCHFPIISHIFPAATLGCRQKTLKKPRDPGLVTPADGGASSEHLVPTKIHWLKQNMVYAILCTRFH